MIVPFLQNSTFTGLISTRDYGTSQDWKEAYRLVLQADKTIAHYLSTTNVVISAAIINGNIINTGEQVSFNQGNATGVYSFAVNVGNATGSTSFAANDGVANGSHSAGFNRGSAFGNYSFSEGYNTNSAGDYSHTEGFLTAASGIAAHAEGLESIASGNYSHAEGRNTVAEGTVSHAEGLESIAAGDYSHAEGIFTEAKNTLSRASGFKATAANNYTSIWSDGNLGTITENVSTTKDGQYMIDASGGVYITSSLGIGTDSSDNALTVRGNISAETISASVYLSGGVNLFDALSASVGVGREDVNTIVVLNSANWNSTYTTVFNTSADWNTAYNISTGYQQTSSSFVSNTFLATNFLPLSGGTLTGGLSVSEDSLFSKSVTILGNLTALGNTTFANTVFNTSTSALSVVNYGPGPALYVFQGPGTYDVASFYDGDGVEVMHIGNANPGGNGYVGINESFPSKELTVKGEISASGTVYALNGNSNTWNNASTTIQNTSSTTTLLQNNSSYFLNQNNNFTFDTNAPTSFINFTHIPSVLIKVNQQNSILDDLNGTITPISGIGNAFSGNISYIGNELVLSALYLNQQYHFNYNDLNYLYGGITFTTLGPVVSAIRFPNLKTCNGISIFAIQNLSEINFNELERVYGSLSLGVGGYGGQFFNLLTDVNFPKLKSIDGSLIIGGYGYGTSPLLTGIKLDNLEWVGNGIQFGDVSSLPASIKTFQVNEINLPKLSYFSGSGASGTFMVRFFPNLKTITLSSLKIARNFSVLTAGCSALSDFNCPELEHIIGGYIFASNFSSVTTTLTSLTFPKLISYSGTSIPGVFATDATLRNVELGTDTLRNFSANFTCNQFLSQQSVDNLLKAFSRLDGTNGTVLYTGIISLAGGNFAPSYTGGVTTTSPGTNFVRTNTVVTASVNSHGHNTDDIVTFTGNGQSSLNGTYTVRVSSANQFEYTTPSFGNITGSGTVTMRRTTVATDGFRYYQNIALRGNAITINLP